MNIVAGRYYFNKATKTLCEVIRTDGHIVIYKNMLEPFNCTTTVETFEKTFAEYNP
jgi:hypothetical protein